MSANETRETRAAPVAAETDGLPWKQRRWAILAVAMAVAMSSLDGSIANVALPTMAADLKVSPAQIVWVVNAVQIAMVATLLPLAALGEIVGHQRIYYGGLILFGIGAIGCAFAQSFEMLVTARLIQGLGSSGMMSVNSALIRFIWPKRILGRGVGVNAMVVSTGITMGPTVASIILSVAPWPWLFAVNIPFVIIAHRPVDNGAAVDAARAAQVRFSRRGPHGRLHGLAGVCARQCGPRAIRGADDR